MGILGVGLKVLRRSPRYVSKRHYRNRKDVIPYQAYVYIDIYCNKNQPIHFNAHFKRNSLIPWCYIFPIITRIQHEIHTTHLYKTPIQHANRKSSRKEELDFIGVIKGGTYI